MATYNYLDKTGLGQVWGKIKTYIGHNFLSKTNTTSYTPTADYHPATKKYVDDVASEIPQPEDEANVVNLLTEYGYFAPLYTYYDYIAMTYNVGDYMPSNSGILTDIAMSSDDIMELSIYYNTSSITEPQPILGIRSNQSGTKQFGLFLTTSTGKLGYWYGGVDTTKSINVLNSGQLNEIIVQPVGVSQTYPTYATVNVNGINYSLQATATGETWNSWLGLFKYGISATQTSTNGTDKYPGYQLGNIIIKDLNNNVSHYLRPAYDGEHYGVADIVTGKFYYNSTYADKYVCGNWS